jgi:hypothetical protein
LNFVTLYLGKCNAELRFFLPVGYKQNTCKVNCDERRERHIPLEVTYAWAADTFLLPSTWPLPPRNWAPTGLFSGPSLRPPACLPWQPSAQEPAASIGMAVIDMRYENPFYLAEDAGAADLIAG